jgi:hypothetical protein
MLWALFLIGARDLFNELVFFLGFFGAIIIPTIIADYLSLYVIRQCLKVATRSMGLAILISIFFGFLAISILAYVAALIGGSLLLLLQNRRGLAVNPGPILVVPNSESVMVTIEMYFYGFLWVIYSFWQSGGLIFFAPAFLVHLWLPLFLVAALINIGLRAFLRAAGLAQRFIKHGDEHPFDAIGIVAATLVFVVTMIWQIAVHFIAPGTSPQIPT